MVNSKKVKAGTVIPALLLTNTPHQMLEFLQARLKEHEVAILEIHARLQNYPLLSIEAISFRRDLLHRSLLLSELKLLVATYKYSVLKQA